MQEETTVNLFYTVDDRFVPQLGAAICSVCENNREADQIVFYAGVLEVTQAHQAQLQELASRYGREIVFLPIDHLRERMGFSFDSLGWNEVVVARLLVDRLLPKSVSRVLYLDADTLVIGSLRELWETDLAGCPLGMVAEPTANHARKKDLGLENMSYFNSGVLLIDLARWRKEETGKQILDFYRSRGGKLFAPDQDAINGALAGRIYELSPKYNFFNIFWYYPYRTLVKISRPAAYLEERAFREAAGDPRIVHFLGEDRPWRRGTTHRYAGLYRKYLAMTPWKDQPQEEGWETYFTLYGLFWKMLKPFPMLQYRIIDGLIPLVMAWRKRARNRKTDPARKGQSA